MAIGVAKPLGLAGAWLLALAQGPAGVREEAWSEDEGKYIESTVKFETRFLARGTLQELAKRGGLQETPSEHGAPGEIPKSGGEKSLA